MNDRLVTTTEPAKQVSHADVLRMAAEALRYRARETPRGPWRWAEPDLDMTEPLLGPAPQWRPPHNVALEATYPTASPPPAHAVSPDVVDPEIGDVLATLLELTAERLEDPGTALDRRHGARGGRGGAQRPAGRTRSSETTAVERQLGVQP